MGKKSKKHNGPHGPRPESKATMYRSLINMGLSDAEVFAQVQKAFPGTGENLTKWYRWELKHRRVS